MERIIKKVEFSVPSQPRALRVAAYARVSSGKDAMLHSLSAQVSYYSKLIQNHVGWLYCGVYADEAMTGTKENRANFQRLLCQCREGKIDLIITKSISRFARNTVTLLQTVRELKNLGVGIYFEEQRIDTLSADGELLLTILASYAQAESESASENAKWRIRKGFENGELVNLRFLFGYRLVKGNVEINPFEAEVVREVFQRAAARESLSSIARDLNERKIDRVFHGVWNTDRVRSLLANEKYTGNALLQKAYRNNHLEKKKTINHGELPMYFAEATHPAIIEPALFDEVQGILRGIAESTKDRTPQKHSIFTGVLRCEKCGKNYKHRINSGRSCWGCSTYIVRGKAHCQSSLIPDDILYSLTAEVLGAGEFDRDLLLQKVTEMSAKDDCITYHLQDGQTVTKTWWHRSRSESWTPEMKEAARQKALSKRRREECQQKQ